ncbi:MAG TPA: hypothetical protein PK264_17395, partial [Hyphomicrobiaceae bacterium]|nr:hypothetical protein [Hyphomicrobiaceae bacterium]
MTTVAAPDCESDAPGGATPPSGADRSADLTLPATLEFLPEPRTDTTVGGTRFSIAVVAALGLHALAVLGLVYVGGTDLAGAGGQTLEGISVDVVSLDQIIAIPETRAAASSAPAVASDGAPHAVDPPPPRLEAKTDPPPEHMEPPADVPPGTPDLTAKPEDTPPPDAIILPHALGANICGVITSAIFAAVLVTVVR